MPLPLNQLLRITSCMYKIQLSLSKRRRQGSKYWIKSSYQRALSLSNLKRSYSKLRSQRKLCFQLLTAWMQTNTFRKNQRSFPSMWWERTVQRKFNTGQWRKYFRMSRKTFTNLVMEIKPKILGSSCQLDIPPEQKVAITLLSLATGKSQATISRLFNIKKWEVGLCIKTVCDAILNVVMPRYIKVPDENQLVEYLDCFETKWGFPQCAGVLESIHIPLNASKLPENAGDYMNNNNGYSLYLQGVVDPTYKFWDVNVGWPGSVTESKVLMSSTLWQKGQEGNLLPDWVKHMNEVRVPIFLLGSSSYPLTNWMLKPVQQSSDGLQEDEINFNKKIAFARSTSEIAFKRLKARWNCLVTGNMCSIDIFPNVVAACCVLHNICEDVKEPVNDEWIVRSERSYQQPLPSSCNSVLGSDAENIQQAIKAHFCN